ncbi:MAG: phosphatase PAP2 family protein [Lachnospiraceae bacterium]|nr:phosphatase PAP2 family protein [Lachnospiraceae bacterium]
MEASILLWIQQYLRNDVLTPIMSGITTLGDHGQFWIILELILLLAAGLTQLINRKKQERTNPFLRPALGCLAAMLLSFLFCNVLLKNLVARTRPYEVIDGLILLAKKPKDYSFPSGHTSLSFACAAALLFTIPKQQHWIAVLLTILAALIGFSRLYLGVHYPTDVLAGLILGCVCGKLGSIYSNALPI